MENFQIFKLIKKYDNYNLIKLSQDIKKEQKK